MAIDPKYLANWSWDIISDASKAKSKLNWSAKYFEELIKEMINEDLVSKIWYKFHNFINYKTNI